MKKKIGIFTPGRVGSERLPNKLVRPLGESCLWDISCQKLDKLSEKYEVFTLCRDPKLIEISNNYNITQITLDEETITLDGPLTKIFGKVDTINSNLTHMMFLNPCLYNLSVETIEKNIEKFLESDADCATSVKEYKNWLFDLEGNSINDIDYKKLNTKIIEPIHAAAHCFHIFNINTFFSTGNMLNPELITLEVPKDETLDVDDMTDYKVAKGIMSKTYVFDIDGTICTMDYSKSLSYDKARPLKKRIMQINELYTAGNIIKLFTARGTETGVDWGNITRDQLNTWGVKYHSLEFGKPSGDCYIDDKGVNDEAFFRD